MPHDVRLQSLEFKQSAETLGIGYVRVNLTHGYSSEVFERKGSVLSDEKKIDFDVNQPIKRVKCANNNASFGYIYAVKFMDKQGSQVSIYDPIQTIRNRDKEHQLGEAEELIGVYGVKGREYWFTSFGFILKVKQN